MKIFKTTVLFILSLLAALSIKTALAQEDFYFLQDQNTFENIVFDDNASDVNNERYTTKFVGDTMKVLQLFVTGTESESAQAAGYSNIGAIGQVNNLIAGMIRNPPVSTGEYIADLGSNLGLPIKPAYAQSSATGWRALAPVLPIWKGFRNITYIVFVIIFVVVGFMIMFRAKINPQTVVTIQSSLPKIVVTLLMITFSYAIAGLMIDLIYIAIYVAVGIFSLSNIIISSERKNLIELLLTKNPFTFVFINGENILLEGPANAIENLIGGILGIDWYESVAEATKLNLVGLLAKLVLGIAVLFSLFKLLFSLLMSYLSIILSVIFAPFQILLNALPGSNSFTGWLKNLFANIIVFPAVAVMFIIAAALIGPHDSWNPYHIESNIGYYPSFKNNQGVWIPPFLMVSESGVDANSFQPLIALGVIMMMPQMVTMIKEQLKIKGGGLAGGVMAGVMAGPKTLASAPSTLFDLGVKGSYVGLGPFAKGMRGMDAKSKKVPDPGAST